MIQYKDCKEIRFDDASADAEQQDVMQLHLEEYAKQVISVIEFNKRETPFGVEQEESYGEKEPLFGTSIRSAIKALKG